ncbi:hypothetical protein [Streptacidiphilus cavernicola]|uniref:non-specific serine/threonine protein kinase n=1 Tax=Streptacidiphilus cavernicola TaxID=3342716 RepID=A0ABV6VU82_9ACTN
MAGGRVLGGRYLLSGRPRGSGAAAVDQRSGAEVQLDAVPLPEVVEPFDQVALPAPGRPDSTSARALTLAAFVAETVPDHPRLSQVFQVFDEAGYLWVAGEAVPGVTLRTLLERGGPLSPYRAAELAYDLVTALRAVHAAGLVHGNVTVDTVLVCDDGTALLGGLVVGVAQEALCGGPGADQPGAGAPGGPWAPVRIRARDARAVIVGAVPERWSPEQTGPPPTDAVPRADAVRSGYAVPPPYAQQPASASPSGYPASPDAPPSGYPAPPVDARMPGYGPPPTAAPSRSSLQDGPLGAPIGSPAPPRPPAFPPPTTPPSPPASPPTTTPAPTTPPPPRGAPRQAPAVGVEADAWALGVLLYRAVAGEAPFPQQDTAELFAAIRSGQFGRPGRPAALPRATATRPGQRQGQNPGQGQGQPPSPPPELPECGPLGPLVARLLRTDPAARPALPEAAESIRQLLVRAPEPIDQDELLSVAALLPVQRRRGEVLEHPEFPHHRHAAPRRHPALLGAALVGGIILFVLLALVLVVSVSR